MIIMLFKNQKSNSALEWHPSTPEPIKSASRLDSLKYAFQGLAEVTRTEKNMQLHWLSMAIIITVALLLQINLHAWIWLIFAITLVFILELVNTSIERVCDAVDLKPNPLIKQSKDIAAAAVLIAIIGALIIGAITFYTNLFPHAVWHSICGI